MSSSRKVVVLLAASAALNLFFLGAATVHVLHHRDGQDDRASWGSRNSARGTQIQAGSSDDGARAQFRKRHGDRGPPEARLLRDIVRSMGGPKDPRVQALLQENREEIRNFRRDIGQAQEQVRAALAKRPYDESAIREALAALQEKTKAAQTRAQTALVELASQLSDDERAQLEKMSPHAGERARGDEAEHD